jgi:AcrR family transcriptional regulator
MRGGGKMPKQTFFNLEFETRQAIVKAAVEEFAQFPFEQASLTKIVEKCGIAKGSMYQYFEDKRDLYLYVVDLAYEQKRAYVGRAFAIKGDIFSVLEAYYLQSFRFAQDHPLFHQVTNRFWDSKAEILRSEIEKGRFSRAQDFAAFLAEAMAKGEVNKDLDPEAVFFVYHAVGKDLIDYFEQGQSTQFLRKVLDVLRYGLTTRREDM